MSQLTKIDYELIKIILPLSKKSGNVLNKRTIVRYFIETSNDYGFSNLTISMWFNISLRTLYRIKANGGSEETIEKMYNMLLDIQFSSDYELYIKIIGGDYE